MANIYEVTVWNTVDGSIEEKLWEATEEDLDAIEWKYGADPFFDIQIDEVSDE